MLQIIEGKEVYVVEFDKVPELPITGVTKEEQLYAVALARAIATGVISEPGKYGITIKDTDDELRWDAYRIYED